MYSLLEPELNQLRDHVLLMGGEVEAAIERAMRALTERDSELAETVLADDDRIDAMELEMDRTCIRVLALKSPEARDLRFVITAVKVTPILERIADHACNIARAALDLNNEPQLSQYIDLPRMSEVAREMLHAALDAFAASDAAAARAVIERDDDIDQLYDRIFHDLMDHMSRDQNAASRAARLILVAKHLERIGDYVTDICEQIVFMKEALVIKHSQLSK
ncbi:MAG TPA: phosphate signaling complex protein PhoU [Blastocatellia bacterium]|nr:phosphate signaling complex protein PhoU [Blastocatellia bacterium]